MAEKICVTTYVAGDYQEYVPIYLYSILKSYPGYHPIVFCGEKLRTNVKKSLEILSNSGIGDFDVVEEALKDIPNSGRRTIASKRWVLYDPKFEDFKHLYIGDVDIFIVPEKPSLTEQHLTHMKALGLPYSNVRRHTDANRLSGLHFVETGPYFKKIRPMLPQYRQMLMDPKFDTNDEAFLKQIIEASGLGLPPISSIDADVNINSQTDPTQAYFRPHHGIHLGLFRSTPEGEKRQILESDVYVEYLEKGRKMMDTPLFRNLRKNIQAESINTVFDNFEAYCSNSK
jgi:hypothetical protein